MIFIKFELLLKKFFPGVKHGKPFFCLLSTLCLISIFYSDTFIYAQTKVQPKNKLAQNAIVKKDPMAINDKAAAQNNQAAADVSADQTADKNGENTGGQESDAAAQNPDDLYNYTPPVVEETSYGWLVFKTFLVLLIMMGGFFLFYKFITSKTGIPNIGRNIVQTIAIAPMGPNKTIQIIELANKLMVIGVTDNNISLIKEITEKDDIDRIKLQSSKTNPPMNTSFQEFLADQIVSIGGFVRKTATMVSKKKTFMKDVKNIYEKRDYNYLNDQKKRLKNLNGNDDE